MTIGAQSPSNDLTAEEYYARFYAQIQQILSETDALHNEVDRQGLKEVLHKYKDSFAKDSLDSGLTNIHMVHIPTNPNVPPTFVQQYKIPIESYEPVQEIVDSMLEKGVIQPCNSTYSAPIWPVLKPNGKWQPTIDYRKLNQQVPLSQWPMTQLDQEIKKIKGSTILSTLDVTSGFWTIPIHPMTNISWHSPSATNSTPSHGAPSAMPTHQQHSKFFLTKHALTPESKATSST